MIGQPLRRREDARVLRGQTRYVDDIERPGLVHAAFVRSPHASAAITAIRGPELGPRRALGAHRASRWATAWRRSRSAGLEG